ncbi:MAG TPA: dUTP diphosphatase [Methylomirabilota bacterium]|jgi:dUTP pyrophosphatase|nr:dUTP diphosphatase [Methylomirabilota bacterium]
MRISVKRLDPDLPLPHYALASDAGLDLHASQRVVIEPGARALVGTGLAVAIPPGWAGLVLPRSGLALRHGVTVLNAPGLIDAGYRGEVKVLLVNHDPRATATVERGERVAQLIVQTVASVELVEVDELPASERGGGGFGSTGV